MINKSLIIFVGILLVSTALGVTTRNREIELSRDEVTTLREFNLTDYQVTDYDRGDYIYRCLFKEVVVKEDYILTESDVETLKSLGYDDFVVGQKITREIKTPVIDNCQIKTRKGLKSDEQILQELDDLEVQYMKDLAVVIENRKQRTETKLREGVTTIK